MTPTYDYRCEKCGVFENFQSITSKPLKKCPNCKSTVKRLISGGAGVVFKGTGFYQTDYKNKPAPAKSTTADTTPEIKKTASSKPQTPTEHKGMGL